MAEVAATAGGWSSLPGVPHRPVAHRQRDMNVGPASGGNNRSKLRRDEDVAVKWVGSEREGMRFIFDHIR